MDHQFPMKSVLTALAMALATSGCGPSETNPGAPARHDTPGTTPVSPDIDDETPRPGPIAPPGPVQPSPVPSLPATTKYDPKQDEAKAAEAKPEEKKAETPK